MLFILSVMLLISKTEQFKRDLAKNIGQGWTVIWVERKVFQP